MRYDLFGLAIKATRLVESSDLTLNLVFSVLWSLKPDNSRKNIKVFMSRVSTRLYQKGSIGLIGIGLFLSIKRPIQRCFWWSIHYTRSISFIYKIKRVAFLTSPTNMSSKFVSWIFSWIKICYQYSIICWIHIDVLSRIILLHTLKYTYQQAGLLFW